MADTHRVAKLEQNLGIVRNKNGLLLKNLASRIDRIAPRFGSLSAKPMQTDEELKDEAMQIFDWLGPQIWPDSPPSDCLTPVTVGGDKHVLRFSNLDDRKYMRPIFHNLIVSKVHTKLKNVRYNGTRYHSLGGNPSEGASEGASNASDTFTPSKTLPSTDSPAALSERSNLESPTSRKRGWETPTTATKRMRTSTTAESDGVDVDSSPSENPQDDPLYLAERILGRHVKCSTFTEFARHRADVRRNGSILRGLKAIFDDNHEATFDRKAFEKGLDRLYKLCGGNQLADQPATHEEQAVFRGTRLAESNRATLESGRISLGLSEKLGQNGPSQGGPIPQITVSEGQDHGNDPTSHEAVPPVIDTVRTQESTGGDRSPAAERNAEPEEVVQPQENAQAQRDAPAQEEIVQTRDSTNPEGCPGAEDNTQAQGAKASGNVENMLSEHGKRSEESGLSTQGRLSEYHRSTADNTTNQDDARVAREPHTRDVSMTAAETQPTLPALLEWSQAGHVCTFVDIPHVLVDVSDLFRLVEEQMPYALRPRYNGFVTVNFSLEIAGKQRRISILRGRGPGSAVLQHVINQVKANRGADGIVNEAIVIDVEAKHEQDSGGDARPS